MQRRNGVSTAETGIFLPTYLKFLHQHYLFSKSSDNACKDRRVGLSVVWGNVEENVLRTSHGQRDGNWKCQIPYDIEADIGESPRVD